MSEPLNIWTIYDHPKDYPEHFVVRRWKIETGQAVAGECKLADTLEEARKLVPWQSTHDDRIVVCHPAQPENWL
jgi:hypothetical protein